MAFASTMMYIYIYHLYILISRLTKGRLRLIWFQRNKSLLYRWPAAAVGRRPEKRARLSNDVHLVAKHHRSPPRTQWPNFDRNKTSVRRKLVERGWRSWSQVWLRNDLLLWEISSLKSLHYPLFHKPNYLIIWDKSYN